MTKNSPSTEKGLGKTEKNKMPVKPKKYKGKILAWLILLILLVLIGYAYYYYRQLHTQHTQLQMQQQSLSQQNQQRIKGLEQQQNKLIAQQAQLIEKLSQRSFSEPQVMLSNAMILVQRAQLLLTTEHDVPTALSLLQAARARLGYVKSYPLSQLQQAISKDIKTLKAVNTIDLTALAQQFNGLNSKIEQLSFSLKQQVIEKVPSKTYKTLWKQAFFNAWDALKNVVVVERTDNSFTPLLGQQQFANFKQYIQILLQQAFWAALNKNTLVYKNSLQQIKMALKQYMFPSNEDAKKIETGLANLEKYDFKTVMPDELSSVAIGRKIQSQLFAQDKGK